jgi:hypothetical protein
MKFTMRLMLAVAAASAVVVPTSAAHAADCSPARVAAEDVQYYEGTGITRDLVFDVVATADPGCHPVGTVQYVVDGVTATAGDSETADFVRATGTLTWTTTSSATQKVPVRMHSDSWPEPDERLELRLSNASGLVVTDPVTTGSLLDDDGMVVRQIETSTDSGKICWVPDTCWVRIKFNVPPRAPVTVHYRTHDQTAIAGQDYAGIRDAKVTVRTGVTSVLVPIKLLRDQSPESDETFGLEVFAPTAGRAVGGIVPVVIRSGQ